MDYAIVPIAPQEQIQRDMLDRLYMAYSDYDAYGAILYWLVLESGYRTYGFNRLGL